MHPKLGIRHWRKAYAPPIIMPKLRRHDLHHNHPVQGIPLVIQAMRIHDSTAQLIRSWTPSSHNEKLVTKLYHDAKTWGTSPPPPSSRIHIYDNATKQELESWNNQITPQLLQFLAIRGIAKTPADWAIHPTHDGYASNHITNTFGHTLPVHLAHPSNCCLVSSNDHCIRDSAGPLSPSATPRRIRYWYNE
jgi:hypothetical protein